MLNESGPFWWWLYLEIWECVEGEDDGADDDEGDGDESDNLDINDNSPHWTGLSSYPGPQWGVRFLEQIPETFLYPAQGARSEELRVLDLQSV